MTDRYGWLRVLAYLCLLFLGMLSVSAQAQTHTFCPTDGVCNWTSVQTLNTEVYSNTYASLQAAITATPEGGILHVPASTTFSTTLSITKNFTMLCSPNTVQTFSGTGDIVLIDGTGLTNNFLSRFVMRGCTFSGNASATNGIHIKNASRLALYDVTTRNVSAKCFYLDSAVSPLLVHAKCSSNEGAFTTVPVNGIYLDNTTSNTTDIDPIIEGVSGCGIVSANASRSIHSGGTSEGNGCSIEDQALSSYNVYDSMDLEANTGTDDVMLRGSHATFRAIANTTGSATSVHVYVGALHTKIDGGYIGKLQIDASNTYTDVRSTWIATTFTNNDGTTNIKDSALFNGSSWRRLPDTIANLTGLPNNTSVAPSLRICEATDCLRQLNGGWSTATTFGANGFAWWESVRAGTAATPLALNLGFGARVIVPELSFAVNSTTADDNFLVRTGSGALSFGSTNGGTDGALTLGSVKPATYLTATNCASAGGTCSSASAGRVSIAAAASTVTVATTAVTANSEIFIQEDASLGTALSVTCNTTTGRAYTVTARTAGTSFVITSSAAPTTNPACLSYRIVN